MMSWDEIAYFFSFSDRNISSVIIGCVIISGLASWIGSFTMLQKKALLGDAISHSILPGICIGFLFHGSKDPLSLMIGALLTGWISIVSIDAITKYSKIKADTAIAIVLSVFFGLGILLLTYIQHSGNAEQSGLEHFLFGKAASLSLDDLKLFAIVGSIIVTLLLLFHRGFHLISFDREYAKSIGFPTKTLQVILSTATVLTVAIGIQAMGVILMAALLITPAAAARMWTNKLHQLIIIAILFGVFSGISGAFISYSAPSMPTGPWIVVIASVIVFISIFFAPKRGILALRKQRNINQQKILRENFLKAVYKKQNGNQYIPYQQLGFTKKDIKQALSVLGKQNLIIYDNDGVYLSESGIIEAERIVRNHRLWELYLTSYVGMKSDHVHDDAEAIEHIITPEIEAELSKLLDHPERDPHNQIIPQRNV